MSPQEVGKTNNMPYNTVGLIGKAAHEGAHVSLNALADYLRAKQCTILVEESVAQEMDGDDFTVCDLVSIGKQADLAVVVGGDGNMVVSCDRRPGLGGNGMTCKICEMTLIEFK